MDGDPVILFVKCPGGKEEYAWSDLIPMSNGTQKKKKKKDKWYFLGGRDLIYQMPLAGWCLAKGLLVLNKLRIYKVTLSGESHRNYTTFWKRKQKYFIM